MTSPSTMRNTVSSNITSVEIRTDLSPLYRIIRPCIRPLRPKLVSFGDPYPAGSPRIRNPPKRRYGVEIEERGLQIPPTPDHPVPQADPDTNIRKMWVYDFHAQYAKERRANIEKQKTYRHTIYYFAGGGFQSPPGSEHWKLCARLAKDLADKHIRVVLVSYPLAPNSPAKDSIPVLRDWLKQALLSDDEDGVTLAGDSAGGNIVLTLGFWWAERLRDLRAQQVNTNAWTKLKSLFVMSPPCDFRNTNPEIARADKMDPVLTIGLTTAAADAWCKDWPCSTGNLKEDPYLSPNFHTTDTWAALRDSRVVLNGLFGTADVLSPDCRVFMELCQQEQIKGKWLVWEGQMHCFPLTVCYGLSDGRAGFEWIKDRMREQI